MAPTTKTDHAIDALFAWLSAATTVATDAAWKTQLHALAEAYEDDAVALCGLLERLEHIAVHAPRRKWMLLMDELTRMYTDGELPDSQAVHKHLLRLQLRFPPSDWAVVIPPADKRLSAPALRTANSFEGQRSATLGRRAARVLRRALTSDDPDRQLPLLERSLPSSQRSGVNLATSLTRSFMTRMSTMLQTSFEETFFCFICFENVPRFHAFGLSLCGHEFCRGCLTAYLEVKIRDGEVYPSCFHDVETVETGEVVTCAAPVIPTDIETLVSSAVWTKYQQFKFNKEFQHGRQCPYCAHSQKCKGPEFPECVCVQCKRVFCYTHSNAHEGGTCADFERKHLKAEKLNRSAIAAIAKPCPGCRNNVEKNGGCNHMTCIVCQTSFCWICGQVVDNVAAPDHFAWWNIAGCAGQQLVDVESQTRVERFGWTFFRMLFLLVCVPIATVITLVLTILTGCCIPCVCWIHEDPRQVFLGTVNTVAMYVQLLIAAIIIAPFSAVAIGVRCVRSCFCTCCFWPAELRESQLDTNVFVVENDVELAQDDEIDL